MSEPSGLMTEAEFKFLLGIPDFLDDEQLQQGNLESSVDLVDNENMTDFDSNNYVPGAETGDKDKLLSSASMNEDSELDEFATLFPPDSDSPPHSIKHEFTPTPFQPEYDTGSVAVQPDLTLSEGSTEWFLGYEKFEAPEDNVTAPIDSAERNSEKITLTHCKADTEPEPTVVQVNIPSFVPPCEPSYDEHNGNGCITCDRETSEIIPNIQEDANDAAHDPAGCASAVQNKIVKPKALRQLKKQPNGIQKRSRKSKVEPRLVAEELLSIANDLTQQSFPNVIAEGDDSELGSFSLSRGPTSAVKRRKSDEERKEADRMASQKSREKKNEQRHQDKMHFEVLKKEVERLIADCKTLTAEIQSHRMAKDKIKCQLEACTIGNYISDLLLSIPVLRPETSASNAANEEENNLVDFSSFDLEKELAAVERPLPEVPPCFGPRSLPNKVRSRITRERTTINDINRKNKIELLEKLKDKFQKHNKCLLKLCRKVNSEMALIKAFTSGECQRFCAELIAGFKGNRSTVCLRIAEWFYDVYILLENFTEFYKIEGKISTGEQSFVPSGGKFSTLWSQTSKQTTILEIDFIPQCPPLRPNIPYYMD